MKRHLVTFLTVLIVGLLPAVRTTAQEPDQGPPTRDQQSAAQQQVGQPQDPQTGVGRISVINGDVSTQRGDLGDWVADTVNTPVAPGDTLTFTLTGVGVSQVPGLSVIEIQESAGAAQATVALTLERFSPA